MSKLNTWVFPISAGRQEPDSGMCCPYLDECSMFRTIALEQDTKHLVWAFCCGEHSDCGRYKKMVAGEHFHSGLMPTGEIMLTDSAERPAG